MGDCYTDCPMFDGTADCTCDKDDGEMKHTCSYTTWMTPEEREVYDRRNRIRMIVYPIIFLVLMFCIGYCKHQINLNSVYRCHGCNGLIPPVTSDHYKKSIETYGYEVCPHCPYNVLRNDNYEVYRNRNIGVTRNIYVKEYMERVERIGED